MTHRVFGIRHHGPGSARSLRATLDSYGPDIVLVEGPPDANDLLHYVGSEGLQPPVALLVYRSDAPLRAVFFPFAQFSPEWQAIRYALEHDVPVRFCDLPMRYVLAVEPQDVAGAGGAGEVLERAPDPITLFAQAAGYDDPETWFDAQIEGRIDAEDLFDALAEGFAAIRSDYEAEDERETRREAWMRRTIARAAGEGYQRIAVVCGAWHAPALLEARPAKGDAALLKGMKWVKTAATWVPWTNYRLAYAGGYGAGIRSPGWYSHLWSRPENVVSDWVSSAAVLLREEGLDAPTSSVIDAVRAAETLAAMRGRRLAGLDELRDAMLATICAGEEAPLALIRSRLEVGDAMGEVPEDACNVPLLHDVQAQQRRLRLPASEEARALDLDLRKETDLLRSRLLHRLLLLGVQWGRQERTGRALGTFHELWTVRWDPEFAIVLVERSIWGNTVDAACDGYLRQQASEERRLPALSALLRRCVLADLPSAIDALLSAIGRRASSADVPDLLAAMAPLAEVVRYGDVRETRADAVLPIVEGLWERIAVELPGACLSLDDDASHHMLQALQDLDGAMRLLDRHDLRDEWFEVLERMGATTGSGVHTLVRGWCCGVLLDAGRLDESRLESLMGLVLSPVTPAPETATWVEGLLSGSGLLILHRDALWIALDRWLISLQGDTFDVLVPLLRRAVSHFTPAERRRMGEKVARLHRQDAASSRYEAAPAVDRRRADLVLPVLAQILGVPRE